jgi:hypothetical protein
VTAALVLLLITPAALAIPAIVTLALITAVWFGLHAYELSGCDVG